jgi:hypothetical protein
VREHDGADFGVGVGMDLLEGEAQEEAALGVGDHDYVALRGFGVGEGFA